MGELMAYNVPTFDQNVSFYNACIKPFESSYPGLVKRIKANKTTFDDGMQLERIARQSEASNLAVSLYMLKYSTPNSTPYTEGKQRVDAFIAKLYELGEESSPDADQNYISKGIVDFMHGNKREFTRLTNQIRGWELGTLEVLHLDKIFHKDDSGGPTSEL